MSNINLSMIEHITESIKKNDPKFKLGDVVIPKFTGLPNVGIIVAIEMSPLWCIKNQMTDFSRWDNLFDGWRLKYVYTLTFNEKVCPISLEEYNELKISHPEIMPYEEYPKMAFIAYPEDDLELFE